MTSGDTGTTVRRSWAVSIDDEARVVSVVYAKLSGFMSIELDGQRIVRAWREWQTVVGGATLEATISGHSLVARVTQAFGTQTYEVALRLDNQTLPGSDEMLESPQVWRRSLRALAVLAITVATITIVATLARSR